LWIPLCGIFTRWLGAHGKSASVAPIVLQVTRFQVFETSLAKFNKIVAIRDASRTNKGFPQTANLSRPKRAQPWPAKLARISSDFLD
jgi:hypothetical protein